jgi:4'-phosphopantetheinyl transferase
MSANPLPEVVVPNAPHSLTENATWSPATAGIPLGSNEVHMWRAFLDVPSDVRERLSAFLSPDELGRAARFKFARDRDRFAVARGILRQLLGGYLGERPQNVLFETLPHGKPTLTAAVKIPSLRFNLSHSHEFGLFAFCFEHEVGIDLEKIRPEVAYEGIEKHYFSPTERTALEALPPELRPEGFFLCWTRKEAYVKAHGKGLHIPLESFDVSLRPDQPAVLNSSDMERWSLYSLRPETGFVGALVAEGHGHRLQFWEWRGSNASQSL